MTHKETRPSTSREGAGLGNVQSLAACTPDIMQTLAEIQTKHVVARYGLAADRARVVAALAFGEAR